MDMKKRYFYIRRRHLLLPVVLTMLFIAGACKKSSILTYNAGSYIQFSHIYTDSSLFSFLAIPDKDTASVALPVQLVGNPANRDRVYKMSVVSALSTATDSNYFLPASFTLKAGQVTDTARIIVRKSAVISVHPVKLVLRLDSTSDLNVGQTEYSVSILYISNILSKPDWWNDYVAGYFLGDYSDKKYKLFIQVTGVADLDPDDDAQLRYYTIEFKNYLLKEKDAGRTVYEDDGSEMTVAMIGG